ncbi:oxalurate catabolism protein HpxZ [Verrucosispora sp. WMMA2044]|uniref:Oxalurate catabolism protein HpxZ n=1 Tax=Verrucosispora sioxanthis TaxID=2499994 RepID=A0A6M1KSJ8_9ACTN|nr:MULTISPECIES: oxalurate catabolism protein HpxZ [Micromonospora]NEE62576.1 oxalurate catabolism protein HpxZ [Verrucosispora sioxanthis]NGM11686.1 oxalurate catabolism protein HpxZ [Verrucosispora sioxanthis]WBB46945.1 oxalurate catabolism protein HpxZ [Verrucosispora sp. WMMA2044]
MEIDRTDVVAEVTAAFAGYEQALVAGDVDGICGYFWDSEATVRFGLADHQYGLDEQRKWRAVQPPLPPGRRLVDTVVTAFGADLAVVTTRFGYAGGATTGRQTQTWVRLPEGWRIVTAHVSEPLPSDPG